MSESPGVNQSTMLYLIESCDSLSKGTLGHRELVKYHEYSESQTRRTISQTHRFTEIEERFNALMVLHSNPILPV